MNVAILRVEGATAGWDSEAFVRDYLPGQQAPWWRAGDTISGRMRSKAGFNLTIADSPTSSALGHNAVTWIRQHDAVVNALKQAGVHAEVVIGISVGAEDQFSASVALTPEELHVLADARIELSVSAYPVQRREH